MSINDDYHLWFAWYPVRLSRPEWQGKGEALKLTRWIWMRGVFRRITGGKTYYSIYAPD